MNNPHNNKFIKIEAWGGILLFFAAIAGLIFNNSSLEQYYDGFVQFPVRFSFNDFSYSKPLIFWVNDGLIAIFFLLIGLEIKTYLFSERTQANEYFKLAFSAAIAGVIVPALVYTAFNFNHTTNMRGWAIPTAMDTAFIIGVLSLLGNRVPGTLRMFLILTSIIDDIIAVLVIAIFYAGEISNLAVIASACILSILLLINQAGVTRGIIYIFLGILLWICVLGSGVHTSIAGVLLAFTIPLKSKSKGPGLANTFKNNLHPWVSFLILPIFAFANTGVDIQSLSVEMLLSPLSLGIMLGLFIGKQLGIFGITCILYKYKVCSLPPNTSWAQMYGASVLCGVGFTMSLFIGILAFESGGPMYDDIIKASVFIASFAAALSGYIVLRFKS